MHVNFSAVSLRTLELPLESGIFGGLSSGIFGKGDFWITLIHSLTVRNTSTTPIEAKLSSARTQHHLAVNYDNTYSLKSELN